MSIITVKSFFKYFNAQSQVMSMQVIYKKRMLALAVGDEMTLSCSVAVLPDGVWSKWTSWSDCSKTCFNHVDDVGIRRRFRSCNHTLAPFNHTHTDSACNGDSEEQEPCNTVHCPGITDAHTETTMSMIYLFSPLSANDVLG